jgi:UDP-N-acetylglucosamine--N-acetylmuramyl-(pentapeptide) pyrophosphoryl-undecaprenol N-acetylglucosamine transferase
MVFGGSQGSRAINGALIDALAILEPQRSALRFVHGTGVSDLERVRAAYAGRGYDAEVVPYIADILRAYEEADLVVARAGASSVSELAACGKAAILIPLPTAAHDHQRFNARKVADAGAAVLLDESDLSGPRLAAAIEELMHAPERIADMERAAAGLAHPEAAGRIADMVGEIAAW